MSFTTLKIPRLYRISRTHNPVDLPSWDFADPQTHSFGNRFDDINGGYRVLYTADSIEGALIECLQDFRPDLALLSRLDDVEQDEPGLLATERTGNVRTGIVPPDFFVNRFLGTIDFEGSEAVNVVAVDSLQEIRARLAAIAHSLGLDDINVATVIGDVPKALHDNRRLLTQHISRYIYDRPHRFSAIACPSTLGADHMNYTLFENPDSQTNG